jgi:hypothetical protein
MKNIKECIKVERRTSDPNGWYEVMLSPFNSAEEAYSYIEKYRKYYPQDQQNYRLSYRWEAIT